MSPALPSPAPRTRIAVAMSGGVDSAVAAARLLDQGHDVVGVTLHLWDYPEEEEAGSHGRCCAPEDQYDARRTADALGFPHFTFDRRELFAEKVVGPFVQAYLDGDTPSPCSDCNRGVKLGELFALADRLGASHVATGHYARVGVSPSGAPFLREGRDRTKDQSYFLYATARERLARLVFPLGESTKSEVRAEAIARDLPGARKGESQELCFVGQGAHAYASFVAARADGRVRPGAILSGDGRLLGQHDGVHHFTVGQRKGLGIAPQTSSAERVFVTAIDPSSAAVTVGEESALFSSEARLDEVALAPEITLPLTARVRVRYRHGGEMASVVADGPQGATLRFDAPVRALTRGQVAVFYDGDRVLGGGRIRSAA
jgi:tRNA-specific 2-thiouridylase